MASGSDNFDQLGIGEIEKAMYVSNENGSNDTGDGSDVKPFKTASYAVGLFMNQLFGNQEFVRSWQKQPWLPPIYMECKENSRYEPILKEQLGELFCQELKKLRGHLENENERQAKKICDIKKELADLDMEVARLEKELCVAETEAAKSRREYNFALLEMDMYEAFADLIEYK